MTYPRGSVPGESAGHAGKLVDRRKLLLGAIAFLAAPAIVRASSLMAIKPVDDLRVIHLIWHKYLIFTRNDGEGWTSREVSADEYAVSALA
jgi:hypothetical protein